MRAAIRRLEGKQIRWQGVRLKAEPTAVGGKRLEAEREAKEERRKKVRS